MSRRANADRIAVCAPIGADASNIRALLERHRLSAKICRNSTELEAELDDDCGALILTEEAANPAMRTTLTRVFAAQPAWSDVPVILLSSGGLSNTGPQLAAELRGPRRTITLIERPLRSATLLATIDTLLAGRHRQFEIRQLLHERDDLLSSLETRVAERTSELRQMVEEMEAFSYSVSHDLRSPLRSLAGFAEALQEDFAAALPPGAQSYCERIVRAARRMDHLTQDVLAYTRIARCAMEVTSVDLDALVSEVIEQYPLLGSSAGSIRIAKPLGCVRGHVPSLVQCFSNLLGNAVKFVPQGRAPAVVIRAEACDGRRRVMVKDNGMGIAPSDHARIFGMFERAVDKAIPGTGIGLAIVKKAVQRMGGKVGVSSTLGEGAEFWIELDDAEPPCHAVTKETGLATFWKESEIPRAVTIASGNE